jgi:hypothetical protein
MSLEALVGVRSSSSFDSHVQTSDLTFNKLFFSSDVSDRYNNLKASWDSLMEAASHGNPRSFYVAVTVALEQVKREELKRKNVEPKE